MTSPRRGTEAIPLRHAPKCRPVRAFRIIRDNWSYLLKIPVLFKRGAFVADIPIVAAAAAERFGLRPDEARMHDFGEVVVRPAKIRQKLAVAVLLGVLRDRTADEAE